MLNTALQRLRHLWTDESGVIGTAAAIGLSLAAIGGQTAAQIHSTRTAGKQNKRALDATERSDTRAADLEGQRLQMERDEGTRRERLYGEAVQRDKERWQDYLRVNEPHWRRGAGALESLYGMAGLPAESAPAYAPPEQPSPAIPPPGTGAGGAPVSGPRTVTPSQTATRRAPTLMPSQASSNGLSLNDLMQLAQADSRMPKPNAVPFYGGTEA